MNPDGVMAARVLKELQGVKRVALGPGFPQRIAPSIPEEVEVVKLNGMSGRLPAPVDIAVVEALEINPQGDLAAPENLDLNGIEARRWIVATRHTHEDGEAKMVRQSRRPVTRAACVDEIITELALIEIESVGFVLKEVAPGVSSDDVRQRVDASLHVADDLQVMEW